MDSEARGACQECGAADVAYRKNGSHLRKLCQACFNKDSARRMRLVNERKRSGTGLPYGRLCACCSEPMLKPVLDHCHKTSATRDWICCRDNLALGRHRDNPIAFLDYAERATRRACAQPARRAEELETAIRQLNRAAYLMRH